VIALEGRRIAFWLVEILRDHKTPERVKERALTVLTYTRDSLVVAPLLHMAMHGPGMLLQVRAREALVLFPYTPVCDHWRREIQHPDTPSPELSSAIVGLGYCGAEGDRALLDSITARARYVSDRRDATISLDRLRRPLAERFDKGIWASAPSSTGEFLPGEELSTAIQHAACGGPCQDGVLLAPEQPLSALRHR
jgi:hypothetical protein